MPTRYFVEMVCDRIAASSIYAGDDYKNDAALKYLERSRDHMFIHKETLDELTYVLKMLAEKGEKPTFRYLRKKVWKDRWKN